FSVGFFFGAAIIKITLFMKTLLKFLISNVHFLMTIYTPIIEQYKIVSRIEELNSALDNSEDLLLKVVRHLAIYKQSLLKSAFYGNLKNKFKGNWKDGELGDIYNFIGGGTPSKKDPSYWNGNIFWASVKDIQEPYLSTTLDRITEKGLKDSSTNLALVDDVILISRINPGKIAIAKSEVAINQDLKIVRPLSSNKIDNKFTYYLFLYLENEIVKLSKGTTVKGIRVDELKSIKISYPDIKTQKSLVSELDQNYSLADDLLASALSCLKRIETYRHIILHKAFRGELIEFDNIDSANDLLIKVKSEKENYLNSIEFLKRKTVKVPQIKKTLLELLKDEFSDETFSMIDIKNRIKLSEKNLKQELFKLLDSKDVNSFFCNDIKEILYKLK
ncbi:restriction endonuclease subunit S, partial [Chryseobacterium sp. NKUCC03_KSP]|uniref:restriction endonuclease subunit S n=1 Tax=Chryseobacterium sp. NKUCC03_KSP TaxID=2842125 RepID=UPI001C5B28E8